MQVCVHSSVHHSRLITCALSGLSPELTVEEVVESRGRFYCLILAVLEFKLQALNTVWQVQAHDVLLQSFDICLQAGLCSGFRTQLHARANSAGAPETVKRVCLVCKT